MGMMKFMLGEKDLPLFKTVSSFKKSLSLPQSKCEEFYPLKTYRLS